MAISVYAVENPQGPTAPLAARRFSGTFRADGYESLVRLLEADFEVTARRTEGAIVLSAGR